MNGMSRPIGRRSLLALLGALTGFVDRDPSIDADSDVDESRPTIASSDYDSIQAALNATGDGHLYVDETTTEEGITLTDDHDGVTIEWLGETWIEQPADPSALGVFVSDSDFESPIDVEFVRFRVRNPHLNDADILDQGTDGFDPNYDRRSALEWRHDSVGPRSLVVRGGHVHHLNGYGLNVRNATERVIVSGLRSEYTAQDGITVSGDGGPDVTIENVVCDYNGRHNVCFLDEIETITCTGVGKRPYVSGIFLEGLTNETDVSLDVEIRDAVRAAEGNHRRILDWSDFNDATLRGRVKAVDPQNCQETALTGDLDDFTLVIERTDGERGTGFTGADGEDGAPAVHVQSSTSTATILVRDEGGYTPLDPAVRILESDQSEITVVTENPLAHSTEIVGTGGANVTVTSTNPWLGGDPGDEFETAHVWIRDELGHSDYRTLGNTIRFAGEDTSDHDRDDATKNTDYVAWFGERAAYNSIDGNAYGAYGKAPVLDDNGTNEDALFDPERD